MQPSETRRSRRGATERLTVRGFVGTIGVFCLLLAALSAPVLAAGAGGGLVLAAAVGRAVGAVRSRIPDTRPWLQLRVPLTDLSVRL